MKKLLILASVMFALGGCSESDGGSGAGPDGKVAVSFVLPGIGVETEVGGAAVASDVSAGGVVGSLASGGVACSDVPATRTGAAVALDEGVTVRIVAYEAGSTLANSASDVYVDEATYVAAKVNDGTGDKIVLKPCTVTLDANGKVASVSETGAKPLYLFPGTYDFYAITPAFASSDHKSVSVAHGDDFASSLTEDVTVKFSGAVEQPDPNATGGSPITGSKGAVTLTTLDRKCARLSFTVSRKSEGVEKAKFRSLWLSKLATSPKNSVSINGDITADTDNSVENMPSTPQSGGGHFNFSVPTGVQTPTNGPDGTTIIPSTPPGGAALPAYLCAVADEVLPKTADTLHLHMEVLFNDHADKTDAQIASDPKSVSVLDARLPEIDYTKDKQYNYRLVLKGGIVFLELTVSDWTAPDPWSVDNLGGSPQVEGIVVGTWTPGGGSNDDMGQGSAGGELNTTDWTWTANQNWNIEFGNYMQAVSQANNWTSNTGDNTSMGNGSASGSMGADGTWTTVGGATNNLGANGSGTANGNGDWTNGGGGNTDNLGSNGSGSTNNGSNWGGSYTNDNATGGIGAE